MRNVSDSIIYDTSSGNMSTGLLARIDSSENATQFLDISNNGNDFTKNVSPLTGTISGEQYMMYNGANYALTTNDPVTTYPFTLSARVRPAVVTAGQRTIVNIARSSSTNRYRGIILTGNRAGIIVNNN